MSGATAAHVAGPKAPTVVGPPAKAPLKADIPTAMMRIATNKSFFPDMIVPLNNFHIMGRVINLKDLWRINASGCHPIPGKPSKVVGEQRKTGPPHK